MDGFGSRAPRAFPAYLATLTLVAACSYGNATGATRAGEVGPQPRETVTGAVSDLELLDRSRRPQVRSLADLLQGRIAGLSVEPTVGGGVSMRVRSAGASFGGTDPLVIVDGDPLPSIAPVLSGFLSAIDPGDVVRVVVLKDASATAIYGTRGRNGVVLITLRHSGH